MIFLLLAHAWSLLLDLIWFGRRAEQDKDLEILLRRQQLPILQRTPWDFHDSEGEGMSRVAPAPSSAMSKVGLS